MGQSKSKSIEELAKLLSGVAAMQEKITMTEALNRDLVIVLFGREGADHQCVEYDLNKVVPLSKDIITWSYNLRIELDNLRKENAELKSEVERLKGKHKIVHVPWWKSLFGRKKTARNLHNDGA